MLSRNGISLRGVGLTGFLYGNGKAVFSGRGTQFFGNVAPVWVERVGRVFGCGNRLRADATWTLRAVLFLVSDEEQTLEVTFEFVTGPVIGVFCMGRQHRLLLGQLE